MPACLPAVEMQPSIWAAIESGALNAAMAASADDALATVRQVLPGIDIAWLRQTMLAASIAFIKMSYKNLPVTSCDRVVARTVGK